MKQRGWIAFSGFVWFAIGANLLYKGLRLISAATLDSDSMCSQMSRFFGTSQQAASFLIAVGLLVGFLKGRFVLGKTVRRVVARIHSLPLPIRFKQAYSPSYWILIGAMMALGMSFRFLPIPIDARGVVDVAIGSALINGALLYFRAARETTCGTGSPSQSP